MIPFNALGIPDLTIFMHTATAGEHTGVIPWVLALFLVLSSTDVTAGQTQPIHMHADRITVRQEKGTIIYRGNVRVRQGGLSMRASRAVTRERNGRIVSVVATGRPVAVRHHPVDQAQPIHIRAKRVRYDPGGDTLDLDGSVTLRQGKDMLQSERLHYDIGNNRVLAKGLTPSARPYAILHPRRKEHQPDTELPGRSPNGPDVAR